MAKHKKQHYIPSCYLKAWCDKSCPTSYTPYLWQFSKVDRSARKKAPENILHESDMYTVHTADSGRDLYIEHGLSRIESNFTDVRDEKLSKKKPLSQEEWIWVCTFLAAMNARTVAFRQHQSKQWQKVLDMSLEVQKWAESASVEELKGAAGLRSSSNKTLSQDDVKELVDNPIQSLLPLHIENLTPLLLLMDCAVFETNDDLGFITSDHPCIWADPEAYKRPPIYRAPGLAYNSTEITLPISPNQVLLLNRKGLSGYISVNERLLDEVNRRTCLNCHEYFIVNSDKTKKNWFRE